MLVFNCAAELERQHVCCIAAWRLTQGMPDFYALLCVLMQAV